MPFNGSGTYSPPGADFPAVTGTVISSSKYNNVINDVASALTGVVTRDGQSPMTAALPMGGQLITGLGAGSVSAPALSFTGDADTGIYKPGAAQWAVSIDGTQRLLVNATGISGNGSQLTALNGTQVTTGTVPVARLNGGTTSQFVRGDGSYSSTLAAGLTLGDSLTINGAVNRKVEIQDSGNSNRGGYLLGLAGGFMVSSNSAVFPTYLAQDGAVVLELDVNKRAIFYAPASGNTVSILANTGVETYTDYVNSLATGLTAYRARNVSGVDFRAGANANTSGLVGTVSNHSLVIQTNSLNRVTVGASGGVTIASPTSGASLTFGEATTQIVPGATALAFKNNANSATNFSISDGGVWTNPRNTQTAFHGYTSASRTTAGIFTTYSELYDRGSGFNPSTGIYTVPTTGMYLITAEIYVASSGGGTAIFDVQVRQGGATTLGTATIYLTVSGSDVRTITFARTLTAATTLDVYLSTISGGTSPNAICNGFTASLLY